MKFVLEYEGTNYHGWQVQPGLITVQGVLEDRLSRLVKEEVKTIVAGRTDAGVHALGQVVNFLTDSHIPLDSWQPAINSVLPEDIRVKEVEEVPLSFNARSSALSRRYRYRILNRDYPSVFERNYSYFYRGEMELDAMREASRCLLGTHNFRSFCASIYERENFIRTVQDITLNREGDIVSLEIEANGFLPHMVRIIVGTLLDIGRGKLAPNEMRDILSAEDRKRAGRTIPARGLYLIEVRY